MIHLIVTLALSLAAHGYIFHPGNYPKAVASCRATRRAPAPMAVDINLSYVDIHPHLRKASTIVMVHGWPSLWSTWSQQILALEVNYRLIIPDLRGFSESTHPGDVRSSGTMFDMVGDLVCILEHASVQAASCIGHDWGSQICYEAARSRPDIFKSVVGISVPYIAATGPFMPIEVLTSIFPRLAYQIFFDKSTEMAIVELNRDIRRSIRATMRTVASPPPENFLESVTSFLDVYDEFEVIPAVPFFSVEEEDYFVEQFALQGFNYTLQFYTYENSYMSWDFAHRQGNATISCPVLAIYPDQDPVADWAKAAALLKSAIFIPHLTTKVVGGSHWVHLENPDGVNEILVPWLKGLDDISIEKHDEL